MPSIQPAYGGSAAVYRLFSLTGSGRSHTRDTGEQAARFQGRSARREIAYFGTPGTGLWIKVIRIRVRPGTVPYG